MNFDLSDEQTVVKDLAQQIFEGHASVERVKDVERNHDGFDEALWNQLARANLLGLCLPEDLGGSGYGLVELCLLLEQQGRHVAPVPLWATVVLGALPIAEFGTDEQKALLDGVISGTVRLSAALSESGADDALRPSVAAIRTETGWHLHGFKPAVPAAQFAHRVLVPVTQDDGLVGIFLVDPHADGIEMQPIDSTSHQPHAHLVIDTDVAAADRLGGDTGNGADQLLWTLERALVGI